MIILLAPSEVADHLVDGRVAKRRNPPRTGFVEMVVLGAEAGAVCVSLLQLPMVYTYFAEAVRNYARTRPSKTVTFELKGPRGAAKFEVDPDDDIGELATRLRDILQ